MAEINPINAHPKFTDFAFVIQGGITKGHRVDTEIIKYILKIRRYFPLNDIIVSCWDVTPNDKLVLEKISSYHRVQFIFNQDPGCISKVYKGVRYNCNINRMIVSTINGVVASNKDYIIKIRSDSYFDSNNLERFLTVFYNEKNPNLERDDNYSVFEERVVNCNLFARNPRSYLPYLFHPGDIFLAGKKNDLIKLFSVKLADENIFESHRRKCFFTLMRLVPEQYLWVNCIKAFKKVDVYGSNKDFSEKFLIESERFYVNNFYVLEPETVQFVWPKHKLQYHNKGKFSVYDTFDWFYLYNKYVLNHEENKSNKRLGREVIIFFMKLYFLVRTNLMMIPLLRMLAIKIFNKRS